MSECKPLNILLVLIELIVSDFGGVTAKQTIAQLLNESLDGIIALPPLERDYLDTGHEEGMDRAQPTYAVLLTQTSLPFGLTVTLNKIASGTQCLREIIEPSILL